jgi:hypothetical protein
MDWPVCEGCGRKLPLPSERGFCTLCLFDIAGRISRAVEGPAPAALVRQNTEDSE